MIFCSFTKILDIRDFIEMMCMTELGFVKMQNRVTRNSATKKNDGVTRRGGYSIN
jgi:hypothetical protein